MTVLNDLFNDEPEHVPNIWQSKRSGRKYDVLSKYRDGEVRAIELESNMLCIIKSSMLERPQQGLKFPPVKAKRQQDVYGY